MWKKYKFHIQNLDCANCARNLENKLNECKEFQNVSLNFAKLTLSLESNVNEDVLEVLRQKAKAIEPGVTIFSEEKGNSSANYYSLLLLFLGFLFYLLSSFLTSNVWKNVFCLISYALLGYKTCYQAICLLRKGILNENFLIVISSLGAFGIGKPMEGFMVLFLYQVGKYLESIAMGNVRKSVTKLVEMKPVIAHKKEKGKYLDLSPEEIKKGDILTVFQGEKVPLDGTLMTKECLLDTSSLTGESKLVSFSSGEQILSGSLNAGAVFEMKATESYENSTVKRILDLIEHASDRKAKTENFVEKASRYYTPIMMVLAFLIFIITPFLFSIRLEESLYRAFMVLVISCPCAIAISVPLCYFAGLGALSKRGILVKGSNFIDALAHVKQIIFDKTGTLTTGQFGIQKLVLIDKDYTAKEVLSLLVSGEKFSLHPLAQSIVREYEKIPLKKISNVKEVKGKGISYMYGKKKVKLGNAKFVKSDLNILGTTIFVSVDNHVIAYALMGDKIKKNAKEVIASLKKQGIFTRMFTGDHLEAAKKVSDTLCLDSFDAELLPDEKFHLFEQAKKSSKEQVVAFVGDGINDAPVLRLSDCGIAMGSGAESALEASDVVIISNDLNKLLEAFELSKRTLFILKQNLIFALGLKFIVLIFSLFGIGSMGLAVFADVGVTLLTILNSLRILKIKK